MKKLIFMAMFAFVCILSSFGQESRCLIPGAGFVTAQLGSNGATDVWVQNYNNFEVQATVNITVLRSNGRQETIPCDVHLNAKESTWMRGILCFDLNDGDKIVGCRAVSASKC